MPRGGKRAGAGRPKGTKNPPKPEMDKREAGRAVLREKVLASMGPLVDAQIANAMGIKYLVVREKTTGKFVRVAEGIASAINADQEIVEVWEKDPSIAAFQDLMDRTLDKPKQHVDVDAEHSGGIAITWLKSE